MSKHTPGPWEAHYLLHHRFRIEAENKSTICDVAMWLVDCDENTANARLIAAAPDMYEALKALRDEINEMKYGKPFAGRPHAKMDAADAALAKAEGRS